MLIIDYPTKTTYFIESNRFFAGRTFEFFKTTKDSLTAVKLSIY